MNLPRPPDTYDNSWANQYTRTLEAENQQLRALIQMLQLNVVPNYTTTGKNNLTPKAGQLVFDTDLAKLCVYSGVAWETVTSV